MHHFAAKNKAYQTVTTSFASIKKKSRLGLFATALCLAVSAQALCAPTASADEEILPEINVNPMKAIPPKPVYFPGEKLKQIKKNHKSLNDIEPAAIGDSSNLGEIMLDPNPAYPDQSAIIRLRKIKEEKQRLDAMVQEPVIGSLNGLPDALPDSVIFEPQAAWLVGPAAASKYSNADQKGCLALNQFSNDFIVGIHASHNQILGITIDTRQHIFKQDTVYPIAMTIGTDSYALMGLASDQSAVAISLDDVPAFGYKVKQTGAIRFVIGATPMYFSTTGLSDGLKRLQHCLNSRGAETIKVQDSTSGEPIVQAIPANAETFAPAYAPEAIKQMEIKRGGKRVPIALAVTELVPAGHKFILERGIDPMTKISWDAGPLWIEVLAAALADHKIYVHLKGKVVRISKTPPQMNKDELPPIIEDKYASNLAGEELREEMRAIEEGRNNEAMTYDEMREWSAEKGDSLSQILSRWSQEAGVKLVLDLDDDFELGEAFAFDGTFEEAVSILMGRFGDGASKPRSMFRSTLFDDTRRTNPALLASMNSGSRLTRYSDLMGKPAPQLEPVGNFPSKNYNGQPLPPSAANKTWRGLEGANLRDLLDRWSSEAGVELVWQMDQMIELKESVKLQGSFTDAVSGVLQQYSDDGFRPVAQLNNDPKTRRQTLIIRLVGSPKAKSESNEMYNDELSKEELEKIKKEEK